MFIYFKVGSEKKLEELFPKDSNFASTQLKIDVDKATKESFARVYEDPFDPTFKMPVIPAELIDRFTVRDIQIDNHRGFRTEGIYQLNGATLRCSQKANVHRSDDGMFGKSEEVVMQQIVDISAPTYTALCSIYHQFRQGKLSPTENWESPQEGTQVEQPTPKNTVSAFDITIAMSGTDFSATTCCMGIFSEAEKINPDDTSHGLITITMLRELGITDQRLGKLYREVCVGSAPKVITLVRAYQLELAGVTKESIDSAIDDGTPLDLDAIMKAVKKKLPAFNVTA